MARGLQAELKQNVPFTSREQEAYLSLLRTADALQSRVEAKLKEFGLTGTQYNALRILRGAGQDGIPCSDIAERMITRDPDITRSRTDGSSMARLQRPGSNCCANSMRRSRSTVANFSVTLDKRSCSC